jgi:hypothetical protein
MTWRTKLVCDCVCRSDRIGLILLLQWWQWHYWTCWIQWRRFSTSWLLVRHVRSFVNLLSPITSLFCTDCRYNSVGLYLNDFNSSHFLLARRRLCHTNLTHTTIITMQTVYRERITDKRNPWKDDARLFTQIWPSDQTPDQTYIELHISPWSLFLNSVLHESIRGKNKNLSYAWFFTNSKKASCTVVQFVLTKVESKSWPVDHHFKNANLPYPAV